MTNVIDLTAKRKEKLLDRIDKLSGNMHIVWEDFQHLMMARIHVLSDHLPIASMMIEQIEAKVEVFNKRISYDKWKRYLNLDKWNEHIEITVKDDDEA
jgi:hypothetical protein